jgi:hypothetical protein
MFELGSIRRDDEPGERDVLQQLDRGNGRMASRMETDDDLVSVSKVALFVQRVRVLG